MGVSGEQGMFTALTEFAVMPRSDELSWPPKSGRNAYIGPIPK